MVLMLQSCEGINRDTSVINPAYDISDASQKFGTAKNTPDQVLYTCYVRLIISFVQEML